MKGELGAIRIWISRVLVRAPLLLFWSAAQVSAGRHLAS